MSYEYFDDDKMNIIVNANRKKEENKRMNIIVILKL